MSQEIIMPKLGLTMTHGIVTRWLKKEGDSVRAGEAVVEIETDKINSEVESPIDGVILKILASEGEERDITVPLCIVGEAGEKLAEAMVQSCAGDAETANLKSTSGTEAGQQPETGKAGPGSVKITPLAKRIAQENGIDYSTIKGTGPEGRIVKEDIEAAITTAKGAQVERQSETQSETQSGVEAVSHATPRRKALEETGSAVAAAPVQPAVTTQPSQPAAAGTDRRTPMAGIRKIVAQRLTQSKHDIPHTYFKITVDAGNLMDMKSRVAGTITAKAGKKPTLNDLLLKAAALVIGEFPDINVSVDGSEIVYHSGINIGIAVDTGRGLIVPVLRSTDKLSLSEVCSRSGDLAERARAGKLGPDELTGGTFTISNLGSYGIDEFTAIINPPESAILAVGKANDTPCARNGEVVIRPVMHLTLSVDHRVIDGSLAARFMKRLKEVLEDPYIMLV